jgi:hypothetical protein
MSDEREWRIEIDIRLPKFWSEAAVREQILMRLNGGEYEEIAEIISARPLWDVTKDETPADMTQKLPGQWLSWCQKIVDLDEMVPHTRGCAICTEFLKRLSSKVELYGNDET